METEAGDKLAKAIQQEMGVVQRSNGGANTMGGRRRKRGP